MLATVDPTVSTLGTPGVKRGRGEFNNDNSESLMVEESPSPAPDREQSRLLRDRMKRQRLCEAAGDSFATCGEKVLGFGRENSSNRILCDEDSNGRENGLGNKRSRGMDKNPDSQPSSSSHAIENGHIFDDQNVRRLESNLYSHMERQMRTSQDQTTKLEKEVGSLKQVINRVVESLREKEEENRVLRKGVAIADGRYRDMQLQVQEMQAERHRDQSHLSQAQNENNRLQMVLMQAHNYIKQLENHIQGNRGLSEMQSGDNRDDFMEPPPPDVF